MPAPSRVILTPDQTATAEQVPTTPAAAQEAAATAQQAAAAAREAAAAAQQAAGTAQVTPGAATTAPGVPDPGAPVAVNVPGIGPVMPMTRDQLRAVTRRGSELSDQLNSAQGRRERLVRDLEKTSDPAVRKGLEERIAVLDGRLISLEKDIAANGELKASLSARLGSLAPEPPPPPKPSLGPITTPVAFFLLLPLALAGARLLWRRGNRPPVQPISPEAASRFAQLEQAIDSVAVEIERVAEGQRFVTRLLREGQPVPDFAVRVEGAPVRRDAEAGR